MDGLSGARVREEADQLAADDFYFQFAAGLVRAAVAGAAICLRGEHEDNGEVVRQNVGVFGRC